MARIRTGSSRRASGFRRFLMRNWLRSAETTKLQTGPHRPTAPRLGLGGRRGSMSADEPEPAPLAPGVPYEDPVRRALYDYLLSLVTSVVRQLLAQHMRQCPTPSCCPACVRVRERIARRKHERKERELAKRISRWRGVVKSIGPLFASRARAAGRTMHLVAEGSRRRETALNGARRRGQGTDRTDQFFSNA